MDQDSKGSNDPIARARQAEREPVRASARNAARLVRRLAPLLLGLHLAFAVPAAADPVKAELSVTTSGGYGRLLFHLAEDVESNVRLAGGVLIIRFNEPVDVGIDRLSLTAPDYVSAARRDPDGRGIRIALARKFTVNSMAAAERLFVDLLPDTWSGQPPGLPQEVVEELNRRTRAAEKKARQQRQLDERRWQKPIRVRIATQPTFTRYVFELPELIGITADRSKDKLALLFDAPIKFDLADARAGAPPTVGTVDTEVEGDTTTVRMKFNGQVDVRTFREDNSYVVDVSVADPHAQRDAPGAGSAPAPAAGKSETRANAFDGISAPDTVPARIAAAAQAANVPLPAARPAPAEAEKPQAAPNTPRAAAASAPAAPTPAPTPAVSTPAVSTPVPTTPAVSTPGAATSAPVVAVPAADNAPRAPDSGARPQEVASPASPSVPESDAPTMQVRAGGEEIAPRPSGPNAPVAVELRRQGDTLRLAFPFASPVPAAVFRRADTLWVVFDSAAPIDVAALADETSRTVRDVKVTRSGEGQVVRIRLERPRLTSLAADGATWTVMIGDAVLEPTRALMASRNIAGPGRSTLTIPFEAPQRLHRLSDPEIGDGILVVTAHGPARGFLKKQDFVDLRLLAATHGVVIQPLADDLRVELAADKLVIGRPGGLTLSAGAHATRRTGVYQVSSFDTQLWGFDRQADFVDRQNKLVYAAASAPEGKRAATRLDLARFYLARDMYPEAKGVLDVTLAEDRQTSEDTAAHVLRAIANVMLDRPEQALRDLSNPLIGNQHDAALWRALARARQGKWAEAREGFRTVEAAMGTLPVELQRLALKESLRASIEVGDFAGASNKLNEFETIGVPPEMEPMLSVLTGRVAEGLGHPDDAYAAYRAAGASTDRPMAAQGRLRDIVLRYGQSEIKRPDAITELEGLAATWRGDETEIEALQLLARFYTEEGRYRDAFHVMRTALTAHPNSDLTRRIHDEAATTFDSLFLAGKGDTLPAVDALSLFYDFRELTPIGRRGDQMIRRLAERLVSVDLLDQAAELLQHQVDHRLQGAARAQVAIRLATVYLMNRKPDRALATLRATRSADISSEMREQRLLVEARALSDIGRHDLALDVVANLEGREAIRLRSDIHWAAKRWRESAEQLELLLGERWRDWQPLNEVERADVLRAAIGYAVGEDKLGLDRFREKFAAKMGEGADRRAFEIAAAPRADNRGEFRELARRIASADTLDGFLRDMRTRFPESGATAPITPPAPAAEPRAPDTTPTGSITRRPAVRRTASR